MPRRPDGHARDQRRQVEHAVGDQPEAERQRRLEPDDAVRRLVELDVLLVAVVRRVVGGDRVDRAVGERRRAAPRRRRRVRSGGVILALVS